MSELAVGSLKGLAANDFVIDVASGSSLDLSAGAVLPAGSILQVVSTTKTDIYSVSLLDGAIDTVDIPSLTVTITPTSASSKLLVSFDLSFGSQGDVILYRDSSAVAGATGDAAGSRVRVSTGGADANANTVQSSSMTFLDDAGSTSSTVYSLRLKNTRGATWTTYINRTGSDTDSTTFSRSISNLTVMEVAA